MSQIGRYNLALQEIAEELGYSTTQDALDDGYHVVHDLVSGEYNLEKINLDKELDNAHVEWLKEKEEVLENLRDAIKFIEGVKYE